jgi:hypothetical protein
MLVLLEAIGFGNEFSQQSPYMLALHTESASLFEGLHLEQGNDHR